MKKLAFYFALVLVLAAVGELLLSASLLYRYRLTGDVQDGSSLASLVVAMETIFAGSESDKSARAEKYEFGLKSDPEPFLHNDDVFGYTAKPGVYSHIYMRRPRGLALSPWEKLLVKVTVNDDGSRWTGRERRSGVANAYVLGDSFVFGSGVNDEHTFAYLLQAALPQTDVHLFALGGYSLVQAYRRIEQLKNTITSHDAIILGYADFYDVRNVSAPSRMKRVDQAREDQRTLRPFGAALKASLDDDGRVRLSLVSEDCRNNGNYCDQPDPPQEYMTQVSVALINGIAAMTPARVYLLHILGSANNPALKQLSRNIEVITVTPDSFDYFIRDDIEGFDPHPGPYWHYAVASRLIKSLREQFAAAPQVATD